ncbi:hypothetical protein ACOMHN_049056 [Nucella lapillus]
MSKMMLTRASTVVLKNRRRYSMRTRNGRPRRQSAPTVLQRAGPPSPRGYYGSSSPSPRRRYPSLSPFRGRPQRGSVGGGEGGVTCQRCHLHTISGRSQNTFTYPQQQPQVVVGAPPTGNHTMGKENTLRRGCVQPHHLTGGGTYTNAGGGGGGDSGGGGVSPRASIFTGMSPPSASSPLSSSSAAAAAANHTAATLASANAALREVKLDSPKLRRITFQDWRRQQKEEEQDCHNCRAAAATTTATATTTTTTTDGSSSSRRGGERHYYQGRVTLSPSGPPSERVVSRSGYCGCGGGGGESRGALLPGEYSSLLPSAPGPSCSSLCQCEGGASGARSVQLLLDYGDNGHYLKAKV